MQCPYNIFDKRIIDSGWLHKLKKKNRSACFRSIFLQGVFIKQKLFDQKYFNKWKNHFDLWFRYLKKNDISGVDYCVNDIINKDFDRIVIGIENFNNFNELLNFKPLKNINNFINLKNNDLGLIDPRKWKLI